MEKIYYKYLKVTAYFQIAIGLLSIFGLFLILILSLDIYIHEVSKKLVDVLVLMVCFALMINVWGILLNNKLLVMCSCIIFMILLILYVIIAKYPIKFKELVAIFLILQPSLGYYMLNIVRKVK